MDLLIQLVLVLLGLVAGAASGMFGIGGGILVVPVLVVLDLLPFREAVAVSLLYITLTSPLGIWRHWRAHNVLVRTGVILGVTGLVGVVVGDLVLPYLTDRMLTLGFAAVLVLAAHNLAYGRLPQAHTHSPALLAAVGFAGGFVAKLFGIGGGIVMVPAMAFTGIPIHSAVGTSLVVVFTNSALGTTINLARMDWAWVVWALPIALGGLAGIPLGVQRVLRMQGHRLRILFALLMVLVALELVRGAI